MCRTTTLHVHHAFLFISLPSLHDHDVKMSNFTFYRERKQATTNFSFSFLTWEINPREIRVHFTFSANWSNREKFEKTRIHFKSDVSAAVAVVDAKTPHFLRKQPTFRDATTGFHAKWSLWNERRNSILMTVTCQICVVLLIGWSKFSTNQKHYPDLGSNASSVWNFCARSSDFISRKKTVVASRCDDVGCFLRLSEFPLNGILWNNNLQN